MDVTVQPRILLARRGPHLWARAAGVRLSLSIASEELHRKGSPSWGVIRVWAHPGQMQNTGGCQDSQQRKVSFFSSPSPEHEVPPKKKKKKIDTIWVSYCVTFLLCKNYLSWRKLWPVGRNLLDLWASPRFGLCLGKESAVEETNNGIRIFLYTWPESEYSFFPFHLPLTPCPPNLSLGKYLQQGFNAFSFLGITFFLLAKGGKMELPLLRVNF